MKFHQAVSCGVAETEKRVAKGQQKGNREIKKPKSAKPKTPAAQETPFLTKAGLGKKPAGKKSR